MKIDSHLIIQRRYLAARKNPEKSMRTTFEEGHSIQENEELGHRLAK
jgi:hypothetical protein